jgi:hypothetical protein
VTAALNYMARLPKPRNKISQTRIYKKRRPPLKTKQ